LNWPKTYELLIEEEPDPVLDELISEQGMSWICPRPGDHLTLTVHDLNTNFFVLLLMGFEVDLATGETTRKVKE
jgi:hypothetical protein